MFWPFTVPINCSSDLENFANSRPSALNFKCFSQSLEQLFLTVGHNNFGNKILFPQWTLQLVWHLMFFSVLIFLLELKKGRKEIGMSVYKCLCQKCIHPTFSFFIMGWNHFWSSLNDQTVFLGLRIFPGYGF